MFVEMGTIIPSSPLVAGLSNGVKKENEYEYLCGKFIV
jgi:hypothetical protein